jgi:hypothetical protein
LLDHVVYRGVGAGLALGVVVHAGIAGSDAGSGSGDCLGEIQPVTGRDVGGVDAEGSLACDHVQCATRETLGAGLEVIDAVLALTDRAGDQLRVCVVPTDSGWRSGLQVAGSAVFVVVVCSVAECTDIIICITCFAAGIGAGFQFFARDSGRAEFAGHGVVAVVDASRFEVIVDTILTGLADVEVVRAGVAAQMSMMRSVSDLIPKPAGIAVLR